MKAGQFSYPDRIIYTEVKSIKTADKIISIIKAAKIAVNPVAAESDLYLDLGFDSLEFVTLLLNIEEAFSIRFELVEMEQCLKIGRLISLTSQKIKDACND